MAGLRTTIGAIGVAFCLLPSVAAAGPWLPSQRVTNPGQDIGSGKITVGANGAMASVGLDPTTDGNVRLEAAVREGGVTPAPGTSRVFGDVTSLSAPFEDRSGNFVDTMVDAQGNVMVVWWPYSRLGSYIETPVMTRYKPAGGAWLPAQQLALQISPWDSQTTSPEFEWSASGYAYFLVEDGLFERTPGSDHFMLVPGSAEFEHIAMNSRGELAAAVYGTTGYEIWTKPPGAAWSKESLGPINTGYPYESERSSLVVTENGTVVTQWNKNSDTYDLPDGGLWAAVRTPGTTYASGTWSSRKLNDGGAFADLFGAGLAVQEPGKVTASWEELVLGTEDYVTVPRESTLVDGPVDSIVAGPLAAVSWPARGRAVVVPPESDRPAGTITARTRPTSSDPLGSPTTVIAPSGTAKAYTPKQVALDEQGNGFLLWDRTISTGPSTPDTHLLGVSAYDPVAPVLTSTAVPATGKAGTAISVSAAATDRISTPAYTWSFGDGSTATTTTATHVYAKAGTYAVKVTATDEAGNASSATRSVVVSAAAALPKVDPRPALWTPSYAGGKTTVRTLELFDLKVNDTVKIVCAGTGCTSAGTQSFTVKTATPKLVTYFGTTGMQLATGATLTATVSRGGSQAQTARFTMNAGKAPTRVITY